MSTPQNIHSGNSSHSTKIRIHGFSCGTIHSFKNHVKQIDFFRLVHTDILCLRMILYFHIPEHGMPLTIQPHTCLYQFQSSDNRFSLGEKTRYCLSLRWIEFGSKINYTWCWNHPRVRLFIKAKKMSTKWNNSNEFLPNNYNNKLSIIA